MKKLEPLTKGKAGWKKRLVEILILETMGRATTPHTGWVIYQKIKHKIQYGSYSNGDAICEIMGSLSQKGYLEKVESDYDGDYRYIPIRFKDRVKLGVSPSTKVRDIKPGEQV